LKDGTDRGAFGVHEFKGQANEVIVTGFDGGQVQTFNKV